MPERFVLLLEAKDAGVSVVLLRRLLKNLSRAYGLKAVSVTRAEVRHPGSPPGPPDGARASRGESVGKAT